VSVCRLVELEERVPVLAAVRPNGPHRVEGFEEAGGTLAVMSRLGGLLDLEAVTVGGGTVGQWVRQAPAGDQDVIAFMPFWVAQDEGLFRKYGLQTQLQYTAGTVGDNALIAGDVQAFQDGTSVISANLKGAQLEYIREDLPYFMFFLEAEPQIQRFSDLVGRAVAVLEPTTADTTSLLQLAEHYGVPMSRLHLVYGHTVPGVLAALESGEVVAAVLSAPSSVLAERAGFHPLVTSGRWRCPPSWAASPSAAIGRRLTPTPSWPCSKAIATRSASSASTRGRRRPWPPTT
jgi:hypothetical protein